LLKDFANLQSGLLLADDDKVIQYFKLTPIFKEVIKPKQTLFDFTYGLIEELLDHKIGNAWVYESALNALRKFHTIQTFTLKI
jgi:integrase/recombinase XerD